MYRVTPRRLANDFGATLPSRSRGSPNARALDSYVAADWTHQKRMRAFLACMAALLSFVVGPGAQERLRTDQKRDEQLGAYLRVGRYADARRVIDQMLRAQRQEDLENLRALFAGPNMSIRRGSASFSCDVDA